MIYMSIDRAAFGDVLREAAWQKQVIAELCDPKWMPRKPVRVGNAEITLKN